MQKSIWLGYDIEVQSNLVLQPTKISFWHEDQFKFQPPEEPFHFMSDALIGLSFLQINPAWKKQFLKKEEQIQFSEQAWHALEPHHELYLRSQERVSALRRHLKNQVTPIVAKFENIFTDVLDQAMEKNTFDIAQALSLIEAIDFLENQLQQPLLYNFALKFSSKISEKMNFLHSMLFNLRSLIALDHNAYIQDPTFQALKVDSITDYLAKAEYIANDAMLYYNFKKISPQVKANPYQQMLEHFKNYLHNGFCLIENLPKSFVNSLNKTELEETLYLVQMDWLLGTDSGLLFKIREELYGLSEGYQSIFWPEAMPSQKRKDHKLSVCCQLKEDLVFPTSSAA